MQQRTKDFNSEEISLKKDYTTAKEKPRKEESYFTPSLQDITIP
jgi:hypothetical protein